MIVKAGLGLIGLSAISIGGVAVTKPHWLGMDYMPDWKPLSKDTNYNSVKTNNYGDGKFANKRGNYLTGVIGNESWWDWSFRRLEKDKGSENSKPGDKFVNAKERGTDTNAINKICESAYKEQESNIDDAGSSAKFKKSDIWKYCSPLGKEPEAVKSDQYTTQVGSTSGANFASVEDGINDLFWTIRQKEIRGDNNFEKITISSYSSDTPFNDTTKPLRELCKKAYEQPNGSGSQPNPTAETTKKYCTISISQS